MDLYMFMTKNLPGYAKKERTNERGEFLLVALVRNCGHRSNHHRRPGAEYLVCTHQIVDGNEAFFNLLGEATRRSCNVLLL